ncbi:MAG: nitrous oxide reductase family maturation protein NosD [Anaerolineales bacterium]|nr:nitrous oxide reductase family maturation protein NosD [Anaerolineales bacterium]
MKRLSIIFLSSLILVGFILLPANSASSSSFIPHPSSFNLQAALDAAQPGQTIQVPSGVYQGNFTISKPVTLEGVDWPILDGNNQGTIITINGTPDVTIRGLVIRNTGTRLDKEDAGIAVNQSPRLVVENNRLENILFGIKVKDSADSQVVNNIIGAKKDLDVAARGDSLLIWYSENSQVIGNQVSHGRDVVLWYNNGAVIRDNVIFGNRYGLHFMYCDDNIVENNRLEANSVGAFLMYSRRLALRHNIFANNRGPSGYGIGLKDIDGVEASDNLFSGNRVGMYFDNSPWSVDVSQHFQRNAFTYNDIGLLFAPSVKRNYFSQNSFIDNSEQVGLTTGGVFAGNSFTVNGQGNFWSDYTGYDADGNGLGDLPYVSKSLFENMMDKNPALRLFQLSPAQQAIELAAHAFPIFQPQPKFSDDAPLLEPITPAVPLPPPGPAWPMWLIAGTWLFIAGGVLVLANLARVKDRVLPVISSVNGPHPRPLSQKGRGEKVQSSLSLWERVRVRAAHPNSNSWGKPMIKVTNLTKKFGNFTAVDALTFEVAAGEAVALWGPNGAGKTTIIRSLLGLLSASGELRVNGFEVEKEGKKARAAIGYVPQELAFYDDMSARDTLLFYAALKHVPAGRVDRVLAEVGLAAHGAKAVTALSGGMKQRLALASALLADPPILVLDEPTSNLDTAARDEFVKLLLRQKAQGKTLLFTSHRLEEVELLADRVLVLEGGKLSLTCHPAELAGRLGMALTLKIIMPEPIRDNALTLLKARGFTVSRNGIGLRVAVSPKAKMAPLHTLWAENIEVNNFELENSQE